MAIAHRVAGGLGDRRRGGTRPLWRRADEPVGVRSVVEPVLLGLGGGEVLRPAGDPVCGRLGGARAVQLKREAVRAEARGGGWG